MPEIPLKQFKLDLVYYQNIVLGLFLVPCVMLSMIFASVVFTNEHLPELVRNIAFFGTFFGSAYIWSYLLSAQCLITVQTMVLIL